jgi:hypothetical protein
MIFQITEVRRTRHLTKSVRNDLPMEYSTCFMLIVEYLGRSAAGLVLMTSYLAVQCDGCCNSRVASAVGEYRGVPFEGIVAVAVTPCLRVAMYDSCLDNLWPTFSGWLERYSTSGLEILFSLPLPNYTLSLPNKTAPSQSQ